MNAAAPSPVPSPRPALTGRMPTVCLVCRDTYAVKPCLPAHDGKESHGYCPACAPAAEAALRAEVIFSCAPKFGPAPVSCSVSRATARRDAHPVFSTASLP